METTNETGIMEKLGVNPGLAGDYRNFALVPTTFTPGSNLGWGQVWVAQHPAVNHLWPDREIFVDGFNVVIKDGDPDDFADLIKAWKRQHNIEIPSAAGRPRNLKGGKTVSMYLDDESLERARSLGQGNVSEGIRAALSNQTPNDTN